MNYSKVAFKKPKYITYNCRMKRFQANAKQEISPVQRLIDEFHPNQKAALRIGTDAMIQHSDADNLRRYADENRKQIETIEKALETRTADNYRMSSIVAGKIKDLKNKLVELKTEIRGVEQSIKDAQDKYAKSSEELTDEFQQKKDSILAESREIEAILEHLADWQRNADSFKSHLSELRSTIHHNRVICSETIAETRQNAQAKIEKHRILLAEAIRQARAESLKLRPGDISDLTTTFLAQSEAHLKSLNSQIDSSRHLSEVNQTIDDENITLQREIDRLTQKNHHLKEQEENQKAVLAKLRLIKNGFKEKEMQERAMKKAASARRREEKRREEEIKAKNAPKPKDEYRMTHEQESFLTYLNECATSIRSILLDILGKNADKKPEEIQTERFEAPKLSAMISEIKTLSSQIGNVQRPSGKEEVIPVLTPAAAYFGFSAPFDNSYTFITSDNWSFGKYDPAATANSTNQGKKPKIIRIRSATKRPSLV